MVQENTDAALKNATKSAFVELCSKRHKQGIQVVERELAAVDEKINHHRRELTNLIRRQQGLSAERIALSDIGSDVVGQIEQEFEMLCSLPKVASVRFHDGNIVIKTVLLYITNPRDGVVRELGEVEVMLRPDSDEIVRFKNLTIEHKGYHHPHVGSGSGFRDACLGNIRPDLLGYVLRYQMVPAFLTVLNYLQTYNERDTVCSAALLCMPVIPPEVVQQLGLADVQPMAA
jgi:hypothetical protein